MPMRIAMGAAFTVSGERVQFAEGPCPWYPTGVVPRTKILATLGPATGSEEAIRTLVDAGASAFRLNFSHGTREEHAARVAAIRRVAGGRPLAIVQDLAGPKLRLDRPVRGQPGDVVELNLPASVRPGDPVLLADGLMQLEVVSPGRARVVVGGELPAGKGINLPSSRLDDVPALTQKDREDLRLGVELGVDYVALSFVRKAADLSEVKAAGVPVIAKFEKAEAVAHLDEIVEAADAIMVARGDLGVEIPIERVPMVQKTLIAAANLLGRPVITATQMLRSMVDSPLPTRAEATDVANAVLDGTDAVMLSEETAVGAYPAAAVRMMGRIAAEAERVLRPRLDPVPEPIGFADHVSRAACELAEQVGAQAIAVPTRTGTTARLVARHRPRAPVLAFSADEAVRRRLALVWGVTAWARPSLEPVDAVLSELRDAIRATGVVEPGGPVVLIGGWPFGSGSVANFVHVTTL
jgi:pyruvate kinase